MTIQSALKKTMERGASPMAAVPVVNGLLALYAGTLSSQTPGWNLLESKAGSAATAQQEASRDRLGRSIPAAGAAAVAATMSWADRAARALSLCATSFPPAAP